MYENSEYGQRMRIVDNALQYIEKKIYNIALKPFMLNFNEAVYWFDYDLAESADEDTEPEELNIDVDINNPEDIFNFLSMLQNDYDIDILPYLLYQNNNIREYAITLLTKILFDSIGYISQSWENVYDTDGLVDKLLVYYQTTDDFAKDVYRAVNECDNVLAHALKEIENTHSKLYSDEVLIDLYYAQ